MEFTITINVKEVLAIVAALLFTTISLLKISLDNGKGEDIDVAIYKNAKKCIAVGFAGLFLMGMISLALFYSNSPLIDIFVPLTISFIYFTLTYIVVKLIVKREDAVKEYLVEKRA